jgi:4-amino-4-deoxy-L-arabinose transferase-like glycosyltransferase
LLILAAAGARLAYLACHCPLDLAPDEAHYWDWSRHLDWSYYSKGPLVAYLVRAGTGLAGAWSERHTGSPALAVRLPAVVCGSLLLASLYVLTVQVFGRPRLAVAVVALALTLPPVAAGSLLMTIDAPYTCCWGWALVLGHRAVFRRSAWAWPAAGLVVGLGVLAKYTMALWLPSLGLFLLTSPTRRRLLLRPGFWALAALAAACCVPVLVWNARHDWVGFHHVLRQSGLGGAAAGVRWHGPFAFAGVQFLLLLGFWFIAWLAAMVAYWPRPGRAEGPSYLWWMSAPTFGLFLLLSLKTAGEPNWPVAGYLSGVVLAVTWCARQLRSPRVWYRRLAAGALAAACVLGLAVTLVMHQPRWLQPVLVRLAGPPTASRPLPLRRLDPTCRLRGWRQLAARVDRLRVQLRQEGIDPVVAGSGWTLPGELGFYCTGRPRVFSLGAALGDRLSQYDLWRPNPVADTERFVGQTVLFVGEPGARLREAFARVERPRVLTYREGGQPVARWKVTVCRGFRGFPRLALPEGRPRY